MEINEKTDETVKSNAISDVNSSIRLFCVLFVRCRDVMMKRQNPSRLADVPSIC